MEEIFYIACRPRCCNIGGGFLSPSDAPSDTGAHQDSAHPHCGNCRPVCQQIGLLPPEKHQIQPRIWESAENAFLDIERLPVLRHRLPPGIHGFIPACHIIPPLTLWFLWTTSKSSAFSSSNALLSFDSIKRDSRRCSFSRRKRRFISAMVRSWVVSLGVIWISPCRGEPHSGEAVELSPLH